jgi:hypothetical protein
MHNISIGDILTDSNEVYRVIAIHHREESLDNPYLEVAVFIWEGDILKFSHEGFIVVRYDESEMGGRRLLLKPYYES